MRKPLQNQGETMSKKTEAQATQATQETQETQAPQEAQATQATQETQETQAPQETQAAQATQETQAAQGKSFYDEILDTVEKVPGVIGEYAGKGARLLFTPLDYIHKHSTAPFIEQFKKAFNDDK